ncbi:MAG: IS4 family transposase, partial [Perlabentimonas sp.]
RCQSSSRSARTAAEDSGCGVPRVHPGYRRSTWWAEFRRTKAGIKLHTLYDVKSSIPTFLYISNAKVHDVNILDLIQYESGSFYVVDKAYVDYRRLYRLHKNGAFFVTRAKDNMRFKRMYSNPADKEQGVLYDQIGKLETYYPKKEYLDKFRRIKYYDQEKDQIFIFLTNNTSLTALEVAMLYKKRWEVELFFKWMKQHLRIKSFWGTTLNAVKIQMYCAIIAYCLVAIVGNKLKVDRTIYEILQILSISLLDKTPIKEMLTKCDYKDVKELNNNQLKISGF